MTTPTADQPTAPHHHDFTRMVLDETDEQTTVLLECPCGDRRIQTRTRVELLDDRDQVRAATGRIEQRSLPPAPPRLHSERKRKMPTCEPTTEAAGTTGEPPRRLAAAYRERDHPFTAPLWRVASRLSQLLAR